MPRLGSHLEQEAHFLNTFPPTWVTEGNKLSLQCSFTPALPQEVSWFRDGEHCKNKVLTHQKFDQLRQEVLLSLYTFLRHPALSFKHCGDKDG